MAPNIQKNAMTNKYFLMEMKLSFFNEKNAPETLKFELSNFYLFFIFINVSC